MISISVPDGNTTPNMKRLLDEYGNSVLRMCFLYLKDTHLAEDALQDTFIKVYTNHSKFKGNSSEKTWIMRITINVCKNYLRSSWWKRIDESTVLENIPGDKDSIEDDSLLLEVMKLSPKYKEVILLYYYQDMKIREIAKALQRPESTVSVRLKRAREVLKVNLKGGFYDE
ncbi:sigma-70 family RNA polymerase sigma factor [Clostridium sediminicola]|uniref:sigma-70 family RNA polymerase sigma factor n=1 Tax=Clostridium sediminicola TaxID=3114879 RepID=UPI0031F1E555